MAVWLMKKNSVIELATNRTYIGLVAFLQRDRRREAKMDVKWEVIYLWRTQPSFASLSTI